ncbi:hypothetical protein FA13DRAFT_1709680 [Coprinellus micaceus]|uniref:Uncharacterized protein n=1 Tax=Coprinellus micaceus TaxID=71717 RepID=A0A4Y7TAM8_COPMI|nr:hypothetical protein FA13DRAFT_1709680 [Coprinellus micaceus]
MEIQRRSSFERDRPFLTGVIIDFWWAFVNGDPIWLLCLPTEIVDAIVGFLPSPVLEILTHSPTFDLMARKHLKSRLSDLMKTWHLPAEGTLTMMRRRNTLLSGSAALQIVDPSSWNPQDLDFYAPSSEFAAVCAWFLTQRYTVSDELTSEYMPQTLTGNDFEFGDDLVDLQHNFPRLRVHASNCIQSVIRLVHPDHPKTINVIQSTSEHPVAPICFFHSTLVMNFVTGNGAVSLYPGLTQDRKGMLNMQLNPPLEPVAETIFEALDKYQQRGYSFFQGSDVEDVEHLVLVPLRGDRVPCAVERLMQRDLDDGKASSLAFDARHPVAVFPALRWSLSTRVYTDDGYYDVGASAEVCQDDEYVVYANDIAVKRVRMAPEAL